MSAQVPRLAFDRVITCQFCDGPESFREIQSLYVADDRVAATDGDEPHVRIFPLADSATGGVRTFGPEGDGPGEVRTPLTAVLLSDGSVMVVDLVQKRITTFSPDDDVVSTIRFNAFPAGAGYARAAGRLLLTITDFKGGLTLVRPLGDAGLDTVLARVPFQDEGMMRFTSPAVRGDGTFAFGEGGEEYLVHVYAPGGKLVRTLRRDVRRRPRTAAEIAALRDRLVISGGGRRRAEGGASTREPEVDPLQPHFSQLNALQFDDRGRLWIRSSRAPAGRTTFDVFGADFAYVGEVSVDRDVGVYSVRDGWLAGATKDDLGIQGIAVWRVLENGG